MKTKQFVWRRSAKLLRLYIRQSSNGLGHGVALLDVGSNPAWRARDQGGRSNRGETEHQLKNTEKRSFSVCFHLNRIYGEAAKLESRGGL